MERMDVAKDPAVKMKGEDLECAYDAVRVANKSVCRHLLIHRCRCTTVLPFPHDLEKNSPVLLFSSVLLSEPGFWRASCGSSTVSGRRNWRL